MDLRFVNDRRLAIEKSHVGGPGDGADKGKGCGAVVHVKMEELLSTWEERSLRMKKIYKIMEILQASRRVR